MNSPRNHENGDESGEVEHPIDRAFRMRDQDFITGTNPPRVPSRQYLRFCQIAGHQAAWDLLLIAKSSAVRVG